VSIAHEQHDDVYRLHMTSAAGRAARIGVSIYVVRGVMIDSGFHRARDIVLETRARLHVDGVIVTHYHEDHAGNVATLARNGVPIAMRAETGAMLRSGPELPLYRRLVWGRPDALDVTVERFEADGFEFVHTPGHSPDHQVVWDAQTGTVFSGDLWLGVRARVLHSAEDPYRIVDSLRRVAALGPARMFDAHRGLVRDPVRALTAKAEWITETIGEIERRIAKGQSDREILATVLGGEELTGFVSHGDYARRNFVKAVRRQLSGG
jgi:glyoxylase-like metal-dependent hydrolase (beta-lactamase superfamily II)